MARRWTEGKWWRDVISYLISRDVISMVGFSSLP